MSDKSEQKLIAGPVEGYKILNEDLTCRDFKFDTTPGTINVLGNDKPLELCGNGFHFCKHPSGVGAYYNSGRVFKIKAYDVLGLPEKPGAHYKLVCSRIEFVEEISIAGDRNTGNYNTGDSNTGNWNAGDWNAGDCNAGHSNTGNCNTGHRNVGDNNTGNGNTGDGNTGGWNTGNWNTGHSNTGHRNTGDNNTGYMNIGHRNTGHGNVGDNHAGSLNHGEAPYYLFNKIVKGPKNTIDFSLVSQLARLLAKDEPIDPTPFLSLPNASKKAIEELHLAHIKARRDWRHQREEI